MRPNRKFYRYAQSGNNDRDIDIEIDSWEDLTGTFHVFTLYDLLLFFAAIQGLLFIFIIPSIKRDNREANRWLMALMALTSFAFFFKILGNHREIAEEYPKIILLPDVIFFVYAPLFFLYLNKLLFHAQGLSRGWWHHLVLPMAQLFVYLPYFLLDDRSFSIKLITRESQTLAVFNVVALVGVAVNFYYWWQSRRVILFYGKLHTTHISDESPIHYFNKVLAVQMLCLLFWSFSAALTAFDVFFAADIPMLIIRSVDATWLIFSIAVYFLGYHALMQPQVVNVAQTMETPPNFIAQDLAINPVSSFYKNGVHSDTATELVATSDTLPKETITKAPVNSGGEGSRLPEEMLEKLKTRVETFVETEKPYTNPNLSLNDLAMKVKLQPHVLSKVINQGFDKNFFDFINSYRVEEFKKRMDNPAFKNYTIISIAYDVGFNSKTAFNRAFKKLTNQTPSQFYNLKNDI
ncbi:MAG: helix-turn-helix domain-containing protein [Saprospiraceae bacterium]|nr:helix-turn-helix domain-containing protein [Saprospiraceae bacterium]